LVFHIDVPDMVGNKPPKLNIDKNWFFFRWRIFLTFCFQASSKSFNKNLAGSRIVQSSNRAVRHLDFMCIMIQDWFFISTCRTWSETNHRHWTSIKIDFFDGVFSLLFVSKHRPNFFIRYGHMHNFFIKIRHFIKT